MIVNKLKEFSNIIASSFINLINFISLISPLNLLTINVIYKSIVIINNNNIYLIK